MQTKLKILVLTIVLAGASSVFADSTYIDNAGSIQADSSAHEHNSIGVGFVYNQNIYDGVGNKIRPFPLLNVTYDNFFIKGSTVGYNAYEDESLTFSFVLQPQFGGYTSDSSDDLKGMSDTSYLINTGVQAQYRLMPFILTVAGLHDVTGRTNGNTASARLAVVIPLDDRRFALIPTLSATWQDKNITDYYYGVSNSETTSTRPEYEPDSALNFSYGLIMKYKLTENWVTTLGYILTQLDDQVSDSPIVSRKYASTALAGISYLF
jgi:outer membrane protein